MNINEANGEDCFSRAINADKCGLKLNRIALENDNRHGDKKVIYR